MKKLIMLQGVPGSGKTTYALAQCAKDPNIVRVNKDDIRKLLLGVDKGAKRDAKDVKKTEREVVLPERDRLISEALRNGKSVIVDDTNLAGKHEARLRGLAKHFGAEFEIVRLDTPLDVCLSRNELREPHERVPKTAICNMWKDMHPGQSVPQPTFAPYVRDTTLPPAFIVDLDGTLCLPNGRNPYDAARCGEDLVNDPVSCLIGLVGLANAFVEGLKELLPAEDAAKVRQFQVIYLSGRSEKYRPQTEEWLRRTNHLGDYPLFMRPADDGRTDWIVKGELFDKHIRGKYDVIFTVDDRNQVVDFWRSIGLTCMQVAPGDF